MELKCGNCGQMVKPGYEVCENCNADLSESALSTEDYNKKLLREREAYIEEWEANGGKKKGRLGCLIFFVVIASIIGIAMLVSYGSNGELVSGIVMNVIFIVANLILYKMRKNKTFEEKRYYNLLPGSSSVTNSLSQFCSGCGSKFGAEEMFCSSCGVKRGE